jgi:hypothetical protein
MSRIRYIVLSLAAAVAGLTWLMSAMPTAAQSAEWLPGDYCLAPAQIQSLSDNRADSGSNYTMVCDVNAAGNGWDCHGVNSTGYIVPWEVYADISPGQSDGVGIVLRDAYVAYDPYDSFHTFEINSTDMLNSETFSPDAPADILYRSTTLYTSGWYTDIVDHLSPDLLSASDGYHRGTNINQEVTNPGNHTPPGTITMTVGGLYVIMPPDSDTCADVEPPEPEPLPLGGYCTFTTTITTTAGTTETAPITSTVTYTRDANLVNNHSFESGSGTPDSWDFLNEPAAQYWLANGARTGGRAVWNTDDYQLIQRLPDYGGYYRMGFYAACPPAAAGGDCDGESAAIQMGGASVASTGGYVLSSTHQAISGTYSSAGVSSWVYLDFNPPGDQYGGNIAVDDVFVWPTDADGNQICDPDAYDPPTDDELTPPDPLPNPGGDDIPLPDGDPRSVTCYECTRPANVIQVGHWIGYLGCLIKNLFTCSLKIWVYNVTNSVLGIWRNVRLFFVWIGDGINLILAWGGGAIESGWGYASGIVSNLWAGLRNIPRSVIEYVYQSDLVQWVWQRLDVLRALYPLAVGFIEALIQVFIDLGEAVIHLIDFLRETFTAIRDAFTAEYYEIVVVTDDGEVIDTILPDQMFADGANLTKVLWLVLSAVSVLDQIVGMYQFEFALIVPVGGLALVTLFWTLRTWEKIIPN